MNAETPGRISKFQRYRAAKRARGLKEVRLWLPDVRSAQFKAQMARAAAELRGAPEEAEALAFIAASMAETIRDDPY